MLLTSRRCNPWEGCEQVSQRGSKMPSPATPPPHAPASWRGTSFSLGEELPSHLSAEACSSGAPTQATGQALPRRGILKPLCLKGPVCPTFRGWGSLVFRTCQGPRPGELGPACSEGRGRIGSDPSDQNCGVGFFPAPACGAARGRALAGPPTIDWSPDRAHSRNAFNIFF